MLHHERRTMEYREMGQTGEKTSLLGYGCMRLPQNEDGTIDYTRTEGLLTKAYESGVNYFDTAYPYHNGESEKVMGKILNKFPRDSYYIATKLPLWLVHSLDDAKHIFEEQLKKLDKDYVDFYLLHAVNKQRFDEIVSYGVIEYCEELQREGKIRHFGFSFHDSYEVFEEVLNYRKWDFCQIQFNYMDTGIQAGMKGYRLAASLGVPIIVMEPVKGGMLAKLPDTVDKYFKNADRNASTASWAFRWVGSLPGIRLVLSGMSDMDQLEDNLKTFSSFKALSAEELDIVDKVKDALSKRVKAGCTGCRYCLPCPAGVAIPYNFQIWNTYSMYMNAGHSKWQWTHDIKDDQKASNCIKCGACEGKCPQGLPIRELLAAAQAELDNIAQ